jgi:uncharacterized integral membrane protein (TIGR00697 family)
MDLLFSNELLWILFLIFDLIITLVVFKFFKKEGLLALISVNIILCNIQVAKLVDLFGFTVTLGNILYGSIFLSTDLLSEFYGKKEATKGVIFGFFFMIFMTIVMQLALQFSPTNEAIEIHTSLISIFSMIPRIAFASMSAYLLSQTHDVWLYHLLKQRTKGKHLWLRNNVSTSISQLIDSVVFCLIAFWGMEMAILIEIIATTYIMKLIVAVVDTPFIYLAKKQNKSA